MAAVTGATWARCDAARLRLPLDTDRPLDAYIAWDRLTDNARHPAAVRAGTTADREALHWPVMVEFEDGPGAQGLEAWCALPALLASGESDLLREAFKPSIERAGGSRIHTAMLPCRLEPLLLTGVSQGLLRRFQLGAPCAVQDLQPWNEALPVLAPGEVLHTLGIIDDGCCLAHEAFRTAQGSRMLALWDQEPQATPGDHWRRWRHTGGASAYRYGMELAQGDINALLARHPGLGECAERGFYAAIDRAGWGRPGRTHGARVMHLLAGPVADAAAPVGDASTLPILFVQLPLQTVGDASGDSLGMHVVDGARYIVERTRRFAGDQPGWRTTINISLGSIAGPHDGSSMAEQALAELAANPAVTLVMAAGNTAGGHQRIHAQRTLVPNGSGSFVVRLPPGHRRDSFVELWLDTSAVAVDRYAVQVTDPDGQTLADLAAGQAAQLAGPGGEVLAALVFARRVAQGLHGTLVLLAIAPTANAPGGTRALASPGFWTIKVSQRGATTVQVHGWIERDDTIVGARRPQQARFEYNSRAPGGDPGVNDRYTLSNLSNAEGVLVAGGYVVSNQTVAAYSANSPLRGSGRNDAPQFYAPSDRSAWLSGMAVPGFYSGSRATISGTSAAAPQVARALVQQQGLPAAGAPQPVPPNGIAAAAPPALRPAHNGQPLPPGAQRLPR